MYCLKPLNLWLFVQAVTKGLHNLVIFILKADNKGTEKSLLKPLEWEEETRTWRTLTRHGIQNGKLYLILVIGAIREKTL